MPETDVVVEDANSPASYLPAGGRQPSPSLGMAQMDPSSEVVRHRIVVIKYNEPSFVKKSIKTKELKTETRNDPLTTHTRT